MVIACNLDRMINGIPTSGKEGKGKTILND
jgi:hypothetical protein